MRAVNGPTVDIGVRRSQSTPARAGATRASVQQCMTDNVGVLRSRESLERALAVVADVSSESDSELANLTTLASAVTASALARTESRGAHSRVEFPDRDETQRRRLIVRG
jgi:L-aspartate oxidase